MGSSEDDPGAGIGILVPISESPTLRETVEYAVLEARDSAADEEEPVTLYLVHLVRQQGILPEEDIRREAERRLADAVRWAESTLDDAADVPMTVGIRSDLLETRSYPFGPLDYADLLLTYAHDNGIGHVIVDPGHRFSATTTVPGSLEAALREADAVTVEDAPVSRPTGRTRLRVRGGASRFFFLFGISTLFYLTLSGTVTGFSIGTGVLTGLVVSTVLTTVTFEREPRVRRMTLTTGRLVLYVPYLLWKIVKANVELAFVILHPSLPIDPKVIRFNAAVWGAFPITTFANSITLTPGTLTIDTDDRTFIVHTLIPGARDELIDGSLERAVRFVFYGRSALGHPTPRERDALVDEEAT